MAWIHLDVSSGVIVGAGSDERFQPRKQVGDVDDFALAIRVALTTTD